MLVQDHRFSTHPHHLLPPPEQRNGGEVPSATEGGAQIPLQRFSVAGAPPRGAGWFESGTQGGLWVSAAELVYGTPLVLPGQPQKKPRFWYPVSQLSPPVRRPYR